MSLDPRRTELAIPPGEELVYPILVLDVIWSR